MNVGTKAFLVAVASSLAVAGTIEIIAPYSPHVRVEHSKQDSTDQTQKGTTSRQPTRTNAADAAMGDYSKQNARKPPNTAKERQNVGENRAMFDITITGIIIAFASSVSAGIGIAIYCVYRDQAGTMGRQLIATETAATAALAALARPWLFVEGLKCDVLSWLQCKEGLIADFHIFNYGNAPAAIKALRVAFFMGPHHHNGLPEELRTKNILNFPCAEELGRFIYNHGRNTMTDTTQPGLIGEDLDSVPRRTFHPNPIELNTVLPGGEKTPTFSIIGHPILEPNPLPGLRIEGLAEPYMIGTIYYSVPGQDDEIMTFCYKANANGGLDLFADYPPFNDRKKVPKPESHGESAYHNTWPPVPRIGQ